MADRKLCLYIAMSLDGYIAAPDDNLDFLSLVSKEGEDYGYEAFLSTVDTVIIGRKTYDWVIKQVGVFPHEDMETWVITRKERPGHGNVRFYSGSVSALVERIRAHEGKNIFVDGGAEIVQLLLKEQLIDAITISIIPILLGKGTRLFDAGFPARQLKLINCRNYETGLVQLQYEGVK
ncbi:MAG: dihydrofolate reductase [Bacteroidales bacterium]|nr:dihydrofolate reductase [Bacteroidales bacterium]